MALRDRQTGWQGSLRVEISLSPTQSAMDRGVGFWKTVAWRGFLLAGALYLVNPFEPFSYSFAPICLLAPGYFEPGPFVENQANGGTPPSHSSPPNYKKTPTFLVSS